MDRSEFVQSCNAWAATGTPFLFVIDFELTRFHMIRLEDAAKEQVFYMVGERSNAAEAMGQQGASTWNERSGAENATGKPRPPGNEGSEKNADGQQHFSREHDGSGEENAEEQQRTDLKRLGIGGSEEYTPTDFRFDISPVSFNRYEKAFLLVRENILHGNSFLLNLTFPTQIDTDLTLQQIFQHSMAPYKLLFKNRFVLFSPETFIKIRDGYIFSYPMKGTIDAAIPQAEQVIMHNEKEMWEHNTIVDLIRNDLSMVAQDVEVTKYRYIDRVRTHKNELLQVSSEIRGRLEGDWKGRLGETLLQLLPAGSISGAPKKKTLEIIATAEGAKRGYFTGIFGIFDGATLDSGVMIRYLERTHRGLQFRSGGGITGNSEVHSEYDEMIAKVYVPFI